MPGKLESAADFTKLLKENKHLRKLLPVCGKCGEVPGIVIDNSSVRDALDVLVYCHNEHARGEISGLIWAGAKGTNDRFALVMGCIRHCTERLGGSPNSAPFIQRAEADCAIEGAHLEQPARVRQPARFALRRLKAPWNF